MDAQSSVTFIIAEIQNNEDVWILNFLDLGKQTDYMGTKKNLWWRRNHPFIAKAENNQLAEEIPGSMEGDRSTEGSLWYLRGYDLPAVWTRQQNERVS